MKIEIVHGELDDKIACNKEMSLACGWKYTTNPNISRYRITCKKCLKVIKRKKK